MRAPLLAPNHVWFAVESAVGAGGISALTCAGPGLEALLARCFRPAGHRAARNSQLLFGHVMAGDRVVDEALCARIPAEESLTGWPTATITCHGGIAVVQAAARALRRAGARRVEETAFWKQAVRAMRRDRPQAEAAAALPRAPTALAAAILLAQREGAGREEIERLRLVAAGGRGPNSAPRRAGACPRPARVCGQSPGRPQGAARHDPPAQDVLESLRRWRSTLPLGRACFSPLRIALVGAPNAGKSTLLNALAGRKRAVVHEEPGTTRDTVEEPGAIEGVPVIWIDTAGLGGPKGAIDAEAQSAGREAARKADLVLVLCEPGEVDAPQAQRPAMGESPSRRLRAALQRVRPLGRAAPAAPENDAWSEFVHAHLGTRTPPWIPVLTKGDLCKNAAPFFGAAPPSLPSAPPPPRVRESASCAVGPGLVPGRGGRESGGPAPAAAHKGRPCRITAPTGEGLDALRTAVLRMLGINDKSRASAPPPGAEPPRSRVAAPQGGVTRDRDLRTGDPVCWNARQAAALDDCLQRAARAARIPNPRRARAALIRALDLLDRRLRWGR